MPAVDIETSPSVLAFKEDLIREIPYVPNTGEAREILRKCEISTLIHIFHMWRQRFIVPQPRHFVVPEELSIDPLYVKHKGEIDAIKAKVERGDEGPCLRCGSGRLELKTGSWGSFLGCSNYPACTAKFDVD